MTDKLDLNWHTFSDHLLDSIKDLNKTNEYSDVTIVCEDYKQFTSDKRDLERLDEGAKSLAQSWHLQAMYNKWKKIRGIDK